LQPGKTWVMLNPGLLTEYGDIFATKGNDYGWTNRAYHCIDRGQARPIHQPLRRLAKLANVGKMLEDIKQCGVTEQSVSPWQSPVVLVQKMNCDLCFSTL
jgi:hypothetical protein